MWLSTLSQDCGHPCTANDPDSLMPISPQHFIDLFKFWIQSVLLPWFHSKTVYDFVFFFYPNTKGFKRKNFSVFVSIFINVTLRHMEKINVYVCCILQSSLRFQDFQELFFLQMFCLLDKEMLLLTEVIKNELIFLNDLNVKWVVAWLSKWMFMCKGFLMAKVNIYSLAE